jgi:hypothetical protein
MLSGKFPGNAEVFLQASNGRVELAWLQTEHAQPSYLYRWLQAVSM